MSQRDAPIQVKTAALDAMSEYLITRLEKDGVRALPYLHEVSVIMTVPANNMRPAKFRLRNVFTNLVAEVFNTENEMSDELNEMSFYRTA